MFCQISQATHEILCIFSVCEAHAKAASQPKISSLLSMYERRKRMECYWRARFGGEWKFVVAASHLCAVVSSFRARISLCELVKPIPVLPHICERTNDIFFSERVLPAHQPQIQMHICDKKLRRYVNPDQVVDFIIT